MGEGFVVMQSNDVDIYYYQDEPGELLHTNAGRQRLSRVILFLAAAFILLGDWKCLQVWFLWSRRAPRRRRHPARTTSFKTYLRVGVWTSCVGRGQILTMDHGLIVRGGEFFLALCNYDIKHCS